MEKTDYLLLVKSVEYAIENKNITTSSLQRKFRIVYPQAARIIETLIEKKLLVKLENNLRAWRIAKTFCCEWCEMAGEESNYPMEEFSRFCGDTEMPICEKCFDHYLDITE